MANHTHHTHPPVKEPVTIKVTTKTILTSVISGVTLIGLIVSYAFAADQRYVDHGELSELAYSTDKQRIDDRIQDYTDKKENINDKIIDGSASNIDKKSLHRYQNRIDSLEREKDRLESSKTN